MLFSFPIHGKLQVDNMDIQTMVKRAVNQFDGIAEA